MTREVDIKYVLRHSGYYLLKEFPDRVIAGLHDYLTTTGIVVGLHLGGYERRYCFDSGDVARQALEDWDGKGHPEGNWIKLKGRYQGFPVNAFNPIHGTSGHFVHLTQEQANAFNRGILFAYELMATTFIKDMMDTTWVWNTENRKWLGADGFGYSESIGKFA